jgi:hypothetical protein
VAVAVAVVGRVPVTCWACFTIITMGEPQGPCGIALAPLEPAD